jgi:hypothetical protein
MPDVPLDNNLVAKILENLRIEPSEHLREMLSHPAGEWGAQSVLESLQWPHRPSPEGCR